MHKPDPLSHQPSLLPPEAPIYVECAVLKNAALDWAIASIVLGLELIEGDGTNPCIFEYGEEFGHESGQFSPTLDWACFGPLLGKFKILFDVKNNPAGGSNLIAYPAGAHAFWMRGDTHVEAACRTILRQHDFGGSHIRIPAEVMRWAQYEDKRRLDAGLVSN